MKYVVHKRYKGKAICGEVNLPATTECESDGSFIIYDSKAICYETSRCAHQFFAANYDGMGMVRGKLTQAIQNKLAERDTHYQERWNKVWKDGICQKYKRADYDDYWLWSHDFFNADIHSLRHIAKLVGAKEVV